MNATRFSRFHVPAALLAGLLLLSVGCSSDDPVGSGSGTITVSAAGTGDFTTIQAAVDSATIGTRIVIQPGTYVERVTVFKSVTLTGSGAATELRMAGAPNPISDESGPGSSAVLIVSGTSDVVIENVMLTGPEDGIQVRNSRRVVIRGVEASGNGDDGVDVRSSSDVSISGVFSGNGDQGVQVRDGSARVVIDGSTAETTVDRGVRIRSSSAVELLGSTSRGNGDDGVQVRESTGVRVVGNTITDNMGYGLRIEASPDTLNQDNVISGNAEGDLRVE